MTADPAPLLEVRQLSVEFHVRGRSLPAVRDVSFTVGQGESLGVLGESGSGKSVTALAVMGLLDERAAVRGEVLLDGTNLLAMKEAQRGSYRGGRIAMIFQDALAALNPVQNVGSQIGEVLRYHQGMSRSDARHQAIQLLDRVGIPAAATRYASYPHELSGGMRQRIMIAIALAGKPSLLIADEPTTSLDVTVQAQIMELLQDLRAETGMSLIFITHDLGLSMEVADRIAVMYAGRVVESGPADEVYFRSRHPYTMGLVNSMPRRVEKGDRLLPIPGAPPSLTRVPTGCAFHPRCPRAEAVCVAETPELLAVGADHVSACHFAREFSAVSP